MNTLPACYLSRVTVRGPALLTAGVIRSRGAAGFLINPPGKLDNEIEDEQQVALKSAAGKRTVAVVLYLLEPVNLNLDNQMSR
ncbi:hypothetical protein J6590_027535 [Homalodisca vitripennis]|nr:hypothetical protein J6590_027535 [Homalodisca vitripennis]